MALHGMIFDVDGTLVDTNPAHVEAWRRAFKRLGYDVAARRIKVEIGGEAIWTALATSSNRKHLQAICDSAGRDLPALDTVHDAQACRGAAVAFLGVLSGDTPAELLLEAGACGVWRDTGHLYADLDHALELASLAAAASR